MCRLENRVPVNNSPVCGMAVQNRAAACCDKWLNAWNARQALPLSKMHPMLRHNSHAIDFPMMQNLLLATLFLLCTPSCFAERADRDKPIFLEADQMQLDDINQTSTFIGKVRLTQGTMMIRGDMIEVAKHKDGYKQAKVYGNVASFMQKREGSEEYVEGYGERIEYDTRNGMVDFYVQARVKREQDEVRGDHITYSMKTETFQVSSASSKNSPPQRVRAVLQPKQKSDGAASPNLEALPITPSNTLTTPK